MTGWRRGGSRVGLSRRWRGGVCRRVGVDRRQVGLVVERYRKRGDGGDDSGTGSDVKKCLLSSAMIRLFLIDWQPGRGVVKIFSFS